MNHLFTFFNRHREWLFTHNMLARLSTVSSHLSMQFVWRCDGHHFDIAFLEHLPVIGKHAGDPIPFRQRGGVSGRW